MLARFDRAPTLLPRLATRLVSERLVLRPPRTADVPEVRRALRANDEHLRPWTPKPHPGEDPTSLTAVSKMVLRHRREWKRGESFILMVTKRVDEARIIGRVAFGTVLRGVFQNAYLGYWIDKDHQGAGYTTEAVRAAVGFAFTALGLHRVQAAVMPVNEASQRVLAKVGFRKEGLAERYLCIAGAWEDHVLFGLTVEEWNPR